MKGFAAGVACVLVTLALIGLTQPAFLSESQPETAAPVVTCEAPCRRIVDEGARWEPAVAVNPADASHLVAASLDVTQDEATGEYGWWPLVHVSFDGGASWNTTRLPGGPSAGPEHPLFAFNAIGDPVIAFLPDGTVVFAGIADARASFPGVPYTATGDAVIVSRSFDGGASWPEATVVKDGAGAYSPGVSELVLGAYGSPSVLMDAQDKAWLSVGADGTVVAAWVRIQSAPPSPFDEAVSIVAASSTDGGASWSPLVTITTGERLQGPFPLILDDGTWLVAFVDQSSHTVRLARSHDAGGSWDVTSLDASTKFPVLARGGGPVGERVFIAYPATKDGFDSEQVPTLRWSDDAGASWSEPLALDVPEAAGATLTALAASPGGTAFATFWHARSEDAELRAVAFRDGRLSAPVVLDVTHGSPAATGDYMGLTRVPGGGAHAVWNAFDGDAFTIASARLSVP